MCKIHLKVKVALTNDSLVLNSWSWNEFAIQKTNVAYPENEWCYLFTNFPFACIFFRVNTALQQFT